MRALVVAPAHVQPDALGRNIRERLIQRLDVHLRIAEKLRVVHVLEARVAAHREIGTIDLQEESRANDLFVLGPHGAGDGRDVRLVGSVVSIGMEDPDRARRHGGEEAIDHIHLRDGAFESRDVVGDERSVLDCNRSTTCRATVGR